MEIIEEKKNKNKVYKPILDGIPDWPVYQLSRNRKEFIEEVTGKTVDHILKTRSKRKQIIDELEATIYREQNRIKRNRWRVDPPDEKKFWAEVKGELVALNNQPVEGKEVEILKRIVSRYANEIAGNFKPSSYRFARRMITFWFRRMLNGARVK